MAASATASPLHGLRRLRGRLSDEIERSPRVGPMALAVLVGLATGLAASLFNGMIDGAHWFFFDTLYEDWLGNGPRATLILIPALGGLLVAPIILRLAPEARGHGVPEVMIAVETRAGRIRPIAPIAKAVASALTIGSGGSTGRQGPIALVGSAVGSAVGQALRLSEANVQLLLAAGAAGGIAASFNAPIAGVFFALEVVLRSFTTRSFSVVVLSSVVATAVAATLRGDDPVIPIPHYELEHVIEIPFYALLGVICGVIAVVFIRALFWTEDRFGDLRFPPPLLMPALGGAIVGALALIDGDILGSGELTVDAVLVGDRATDVVMLLLVLKLIATSVTLGSGGSGGVFFPSLFMGAMAGSAYGGILNDLAPDLTAPSGAYATVGMAALFAGTARAPITAVLVLFELTRDYEIMLPLMTAVAAATVVSQLLSSGTIYTIKVQRHGVVVDEEHEPVNLMRTIRVSEAMSPIRASVSRDATVADVMRALEGDPEASALVLTDEGEIHGLVTNFDLNALIAEGRDEGVTAGEFCTRDLQTIYPDQSLHQALSVFSMRGIHALPVVSRRNDRIPEGMLRRSDITQAYSQQVEIRDAARRRRRLAPATAGDDVRYLDLRVQPRSAVNGRILAEIALTSDAVVVAVRHNGATLIPRGNTRLEVGDRVTVITTAAASERVRALFEGMPTP